MSIREMLAMIADAGYSEAKIAKEVGVSQPTVHRLKAGITATTSYEVGKAIEQLYASVISAKAA